MAKKKHKKIPAVRVAKARASTRSRVFSRFKLELRRLSPSLGIALMCASVVFFASWVGLFDLLRVDSWTERKFVQYADAFTDADIAPEVVLITGVEDAQGNGDLGAPSAHWRRYHAELIDALARAKARVVAFDLYFEDSSPGDLDFGQAIKRATDSGTTVVVGVREFKTYEGVVNPNVTPALRQILRERNWGFLKVGGADKGTAAVRKLKLAQEINSNLPSWTQTQKSKVVPSFTLQVLQAGLLPPVGAAYYDKMESQVELLGDAEKVVKYIPVDEAINFIVNAKETALLDKINHPYHEVYNNRLNSDYLRDFFHDRIVIIGYRTRADSPGVADGDNTYGVQIQASAVSDLLQSVYISKLRPISSFLVLVVMSLIGLIIGTRFRHIMRPTMPVSFGSVGFQIGLPLLLVAITAVYLLVAVVLYKHNRVLLGIPYHVAVLLLTFVVADHLESRKTRRNQ